MSLNTSIGNMYDFVSHTFNVIKGVCPHKCSYCYMKSMGGRIQKPIRFDSSEQKSKLGNGNFIFVGSSCDMFAESIPEKWIIDTLDYCKQFDNSYLFQSKNVAGIVKYKYYLPENSVVCTTIETNRWYGSIMNNCPTPQQKASDMVKLTGHKKYVTIEPIMDFDIDELVDLVKQCNPEQVNIGADSGGNKLPEPCKEQVLELIGRLEEFTKVKTKKNLKRIIK